MKVLFLVPYPFDQAPSQRFRLEQYFKILEKRSHSYTIHSFMDEKTWQNIYKSEKNLLKALGIIKGFMSRLLMLFKVHQFDFIFIHREASPIGPPIFEWIIAKILLKKIIYDFDDAIWLPNTSDQNKIAAGLKWHLKVRQICQWSYKISCGNQYLCNFALQFNKNVVLNPTTIDTKKIHNSALYPPDNNLKPVIGWTGTHSTLPYLEIIVPVLQQLELQYDFTFLVIANKTPDLPLKCLKFKFWSKETEIQDLMKFDIGLMPLNDDIWAKGKCGFKALQYMALEIPAVASPVGVNRSIVEDGVNGYLCDTSVEWYNKIEILLRNPELRVKLGQKGRHKVINNYSVASNSDNFLGLFE